MHDPAEDRRQHPAQPGSVSSTLLEGVKARQAEAWTRLADLYGPVVYSWGRRAGVSGDDAADVVQEVFAAAAAHIDGFRRERPGDSFTAWLRTITCNKIRDHFRCLHGRPAAQGGTGAQQRFLETPDLPEPEAAAGLSYAAELLKKAGLELVRAEFENRTWDAFWRVVVEGQRPAGVAADLGMSLEAVYKAKSRVLGRLRRELDGLIG